MRKLKYPAIYKHFKGNYYMTIGCSKPIEFQTLIGICKLRDIDTTELIKLSAKHTETQDDIKIFELDRTYYHLEDACEEKLVLYEPLYNSRGAYARPLDMFLSEVDREKYPNVKQKYRLEEIYGLLY